LQKRFGIKTALKLSICHEQTNLIMFELIAQQQQYQNHLESYTPHVKSPYCLNHVPRHQLIFHRVDVFFALCNRRTSSSHSIIFW
jgi:hypothetical protein